MKAHWIVSVEDLRNRKVIQTAYFDGNMTAAKKYFKNLPVIKRHMGKVGYIISMQPNAIILWDGWTKEYGYNPKHRKKNPEHEIRELILFSENSPSMHNQYTAIMKNLSRKQKRGVYDPVLAAKLWKYWIDEGVKQYNKEILGGGYSLRQNVFTMADRKQAAIEMEEQEREEVFSLEYLKNPSRRKTVRKKKRSAKQLANDKRLGRMAKARAKLRAGRDPTKRKMTAAKRRRLAAKPLRYNPKRKKNVHATRRRKIRMPVKAKSHLFVVFKCKGPAVWFMRFNNQGKVTFTTDKGKSILFRTKADAKFATESGKILRGWDLGIAPADMTKAQIAAQCKAGKV